MSIAEVRDAVIVPLYAFCDSVPIIKADDIGDRPEGTHATYKITLASKDIGQAAKGGEMVGGVFYVTSKTMERVTLSFNAYAADDFASRELADKIHGWFTFHGLETLDDAGIAVIEVTDIENRDVMILDEYERRNGFDVILRVGKVMSKQMDYIENADIQGGVKREQ